MDDGEQQRLARLKDDERRRSARQTAMRKLLSQDDAALEDKVAAVKTVQKEDNTRVVSAISIMLGQDRKSSSPESKLWVEALGRSFESKP